MAGEYCEKNVNRFRRSGSLVNMVTTMAIGIGCKRKTIVLGAEEGGGRKRMLVFTVRLGEILDMCFGFEIR